MKHWGYDHIPQSSFLYEDLEDMEGDIFGFTILEGNQVACFDSGGEKFLCFRQVLEIIKCTNIPTIESTISKLGLVLIDSSPIKVNILHQYGILSLGINYCSLISQSNAERLCKYLNISNAPKSQSYLLNPHRKYITPSKHQHRIRVVHDCFGQQKGILFPQFYISIESKCIECFDCGEVLSPSNFVGHTHNSGYNKEISLCHWGFKSSNWRWYLRLAEDPSRNEDEEASLKEYLEEIKRRYTQPIEDQLIVSTEQDRQTPIDSESLNTSPSLPTPPSLSPPLTMNKNNQQQGSIFQQCIMKIYNTPLANNEDRNQILNFLFMMRQEHLKQMSTLISERQNMIKSAVETIESQPNNESTEFSVNNRIQEESHTQLLNSVQNKLSILKKFKCVKRKCLSPLTDSENIKQSKELIILENSTISKSEVILCDSSASNSKMTAISSREFQEIGTD